MESGREERWCCCWAKKEKAKPTDRPTDRRPAEPENFYPTKKK